MGKSLSVNINELILGRELSLPIHDSKGVLLTGPGTVITAELKDKLLSRGVRNVLIDEADAAHATLSQIDEEQVFPALEKQLNERLDNLIRSGMMTVRNTGPSVSEKVVRHGCKHYDSKQQASVAAQNEKNAEAVGEVLDAAVNGEDLDADRVDGLAEDCIASLVADVDAAISAGFARADQTTIGEHSLKVSTLAMAIGIESGLDKDNLRVVGMSGLLAGLGMTRIPEHLTAAARRLTEVEFVEIQKSPIRTANMLEKVPGIPSIIQIIAYQMHERPDGSGYPRKRTKSSIHPFALILQVADIYTALTSKRPYRPVLMPYAAITTLLDEARRGRVDSNVVRCLLHVVSLFPIGSLVTLSDGSVAQVLRSNRENFANPIVGRLQHADGTVMDADDDDALLDLSKSEVTVVQALPTPGRDEVESLEQVRDSEEGSESSQPVESAATVDAS